MPNYWVTFRIHSDAKYQERYDNFLEAMIDARTAGSWGEPTSFWIVGSSLGIDAFTKRLASALNPKTDILVVRELSKDSSRHFGAIEHLEVLRSFLPNIKKAG